MDRIFEQWEWVEQTGLWYEPEKRLVFSLQRQNDTVFHLRVNVYLAAFSVLNDLVVLLLLSVHLRASYGWPWTQVGNVISQGRRE